VGRFEPEYLGKLDFYLEALDRDVHKTHEQPSIGILLCNTKDDEVVKYAMNRTLSPALVAEDLFIIGLIKRVTEDTISNDFHHHC